MVQSYAKTEIIKGIRNEDKRILLWLYNQILPVFENYVKNNGGSSYEAKDIFQDVLMIVYERIRNDSFQPELNVPEYIYGMCRYRWLERFKRIRKQQNYEDMERKSPELPEEMLIYPKPPINFEEKKLALYVKYITSLGKKCRVLLRMLARGIPVNEISEILGHPSLKSTYNQKAYCLGKLIEKIKKDPDFYYLDEEW